jgi:hypothetical protein
VKKEWPQETEEYRQHITKEEYTIAAGVVHKLKHKFVLLSATQAYELASVHEKCLKEGNPQYVEEYENILLDLTHYINNTNPGDL